jgi:carbon storage regulator
MLVLSRKLGQSIIVNGDITITVVSLDRGRVQLGVTAPFEVSIHREEIQRRIRLQELSARTPLEPVTAN